MGAVNPALIFIMPRKKEFIENDVLIDAVDIFWSKGYSATSIQDLVSGLKINRASLYDTFGGKKELFNKGFDWYCKGNAENLQRLLLQYPDPKVGFKIILDKAIEESCSQNENKGCFVVNTTTELLPGDADVQSRIEESNERVKSIFHQYLINGKKGGYLKTDVDLKSLASFIFTFMNGLRVISTVDRSRESLDSNAKLLLAMVY
ncbi:MAG: TetR/AcrR family transcriptional regulator [Candidatus Kapaibacteriales bacterium]